MNYGIKRIIKEKKLKNETIIMAEMEGYNLYSVLIFDKNNNLIFSNSNYYFKERYKKDILKLTRNIYKNKIQEYYKNS